MSFKKSIKYNNDPGKAIKLAKDTFLPLDFKITNITDHFIELVAQDNFIPKPGWRKQPEESLHCVTKISLSFTHRKIFIQADFSDINKSISFAPIAIAIIFITILVAIDIKLYLEEQAIPLMIFLPIIALFAFIAGVLSFVPGVRANRTATKKLEALINEIETLE